MTDASTARSSSRPLLRWGLLGLLIAVSLACLAVSGWTIADRGAGDDPLDKIQSLREPPADPAAEREQILAAARTFVQRFNTYGPDLLDDQGRMPEYAEVGDLMTAKFRTVFEENLGVAERTVKETRIDRVGTPYAVGVASMDPDSAEALVAGTVTFSYPDPKNPEESVAFEPLRFRYQVSLVQVDGAWLVDDLDDIDDQLPSFAEATIPDPTAPGGQPSGQPSEQPSPAPSDEPSQEPSQ